MYLISRRCEKTRGKRNFCRQDRGGNVRARVFIRKRLGREPTKGELEDLSEEGCWVHSVTPEDVMQKEKRLAHQKINYNFLHLFTEASFNHSDTWEFG